MTSPESQSSQYTVVARRYRPQAFTDLVGQNHIAQALSNAIKQNRVGHAYLFTGARGVGKTSSARIFAKCLNCQNGPTDAPCNACDICQAVSVGEDLDVLEIDGASNRGIDEIRQLRSNAIVRPSRATFKIYIIDEVHMLTQQAFNALLKTLEEPPDHVKFIFCTTDPQKIPITVLSRCQRFDFSPVQTDEITQRLREICAQENVQADDEALAALSRRAAGSMRDSQSLLEQLFSFCEDSISVDDVHQLLGTADTGRIGEIVSSICDKDTATCLNQVAAAIEGGVDAGQLSTQLLGYFRDMMAMAVGASSDVLLTCNASDRERLQQEAGGIGLETALSIVQILDQCVTRMQSSLHGRTLLEVALVRLCNLEHLNVLSDLIEELGTATPVPNRSGGSKPQTAKKNALAEAPPSVQPKTAGTGSLPDAPTSHSASDTKPPSSGTDGSPRKLSLSDANLSAIWLEAGKHIGGMAEDMASQNKKLVCQNGLLVVTVGEPHVAEFCRRSDRLQEFQAALKKITGTDLRLEFRVEKNQTKPQTPPAPKMSRVQMMRQLEQNELVKSAMEVFEAEVVEFRDLRGGR